MRNRELDGLRGLACLIVVVGHAFGSSWAWANWPGLLGGIPKIGVWLFFVLSAFLLTIRLLEENISFSCLARYAIARLARILPPFFIAVIFYRLIDSGSFDTNSQMLSVLMLQVPYKHLWTIPVEMKFYLVLPFMVIALRLSLKVMGKYLTFLALTAAIMIMQYYAPTVNKMNYLSVAPYLACFGTGVAVALLVYLGPRPPSAAGNILATVAVISIALLVLLNKAGHLGDFRTGLFQHTTTFGALWAILIYGIYNNEGCWNRFFSSVLLRKIGEISFSVYLFHWAFIIWTKDLVFPIGMLLAVGFSLALGLLCYHAIEKPLTELRKLVYRRLGL